MLHCHAGGGKVFTNRAIPRDGLAEAWELSPEECRRVLRPGGALCYTVPTIVGRLTRSTVGRPPSYHGFPKDAGDEGLRVQMEFGADAWLWPMRAGFHAVTVTQQEFPAALALTAWNGPPTPLARDAPAPRGFLQRFLGKR